MIPPKPKRVHKSPEEREAEILAAAAVLFAEKGFRAMDVQQVADRARVGKGTVYRYFNTKEDLFLAALRNNMEDLSDTARAAAEAVTDPLEKIRQSMRAIILFFERHPETAELWLQERVEFRDQPTPLYFIYRDAHYDEWRDVFRQLADDGRLRNPDVTAAMEALGHLIYGFVLSKPLPTDTRRPHERFDDVFTVYLNGILKDA